MDIINLILSIKGYFKKDNSQKNYPEKDNREN
jgi:hypothetical protein